MERKIEELQHELTLLKAASTSEAAVPTGIPRGALLLTSSTGSSRGKGKKKGSKGKGAPRTGPLGSVLARPSRFPPSFNAIPTYYVRRRFVSNEAIALTNAAWNLSHGHNQFCMATTTTALLPFVEMWRITKISIWVINYVDNGTTATLYPVGTDIDSNSYNDRERAFSCSSRSEAEPGAMAVIPSRSTPLGSWHKTSLVNSSGTLFVLNVDYGGASSGNWATVTMDIEFEIVLNTFGLSPGYSRTVVGPASVGTMYGSDWPSSAVPAMLLQSVNKI